MAGNNLTASLTLTLKDELTRGLDWLRERFDALRNLGNRLSLGKLETGASGLNRASEAAQGLARHLNGITASADRAWASISRFGNKHFGKGMSRTEAFTAAVSGYSVIEPIRQYADFENQLRHIAITKGLSGAAATAEIARLTKVIDADALRGGQSSTSVAAAYYGLQTGGAGTTGQVEEALTAHTRAATAYNIDPETFTPVTLALMKNFKIFGDDLGRSLAAVGQASKEGQLKVSDYALTLPQVAGAMNTYGLTGFKNANLAIAALQAIRSDVGEAGQAGTDYAEMLRSLYSNQGQKGFALLGKGASGHGAGSEFGERARALMIKATGGYGGIDVSRLIDNAAKEGIGPVDAVLGKLMQIKSKLTAHEFSDLLNQMFTNQEALKGWQALLNHAEQFTSLRNEINGIDTSKVTRDFGTGMDAPKIKMRIFTEQLTQLGRQAGEAFLPILIDINYALGYLLGFLDSLDAMLPGTKDHVLLVAGGMMAFYAAAAAIGMMLPAFTAGFAIIAGLFTATLPVLGALWTALTYVVAIVEAIVPALAALAGVSALVVGVIIVLAAAFVAAAYDIYANWQEFSGFFETLWRGAKDVIQGFLDFLVGVATLNFDKAIGGLMRMMRGLGEFFGSIFDIIGQLFVDFGSFVNNWTGGALTGAVNGIKAAFNGLVSWFVALWADIRAPFDSLVDAVLNNPLARLMGLSSTPQLQTPGYADAGGAAPTAPSVVGQAVHGTVMVGVDPNNGQIRINRTESGTSGFSLVNSMLDAGAVLGIP